MKKNKKIFKKVLTNIFFSDIIISEGNRIPKKAARRKKGMVLDMLDLENVKSMLQSGVKHREEARAAWEHYRTSNDKYLAEVYEKMYIKYRSRLNGMFDILFEMGYIVHVDDDNIVRVENYGEIPF